MAAEGAPTADVGAAADGGSAVGTLLRGYRVKAGYDLTELSRQLRIRRAFLEAIEDGRFKDLPGPTYAIGFVRAYADYFGLDAQEVARQFRSESGERNGAQALHFPAPVAEGGTPRAAIILIGLLIAGVAYGVWYLNSVHGNLIADIVGPVPERLRHLIGADKQIAGEAGGRKAGAEGTTTAAQQEAPLVVVPMPPRSAPAPETAPPPGTSMANRPAPVPPPPVAAPSQTPETQAQAGAAAPTGTAPLGTAPSGATTAPVAPQSATATAAATPTPPATAEATSPPADQASAATAPAAPPESGSRVLLRATADCWVQVRDPATRSTLLSRVLKAGETFAVPDTPGLVMTVGNAGGLEVVVDGTVLPPLGRSGAVRRNIPLDLEALRHASAGGN